MGAIAEKPEICELYGVALSASNLTIEEGHERALDRVAALGAAARHVELGADYEGTTIASATVAGRLIGERNRLASEIGPMLWHMRYGAQLQLVGPTLRLFVPYCLQRSTFDDILLLDDRRAWVEQFAARVLHEWLSDRCQGCGGTGVQERVQGGEPIRPRGRMRNATFVTCTVCRGSGAPKPRPAERARCLGINRAWYEKLGWPRRFDAGLIWLDNIALRLQRPLTQQLGRCSIRPRAVQRAR